MKFKKGTGTMTAKVRGESIGAGFSSGVKGVGGGGGAVEDEQIFG